MNWRIICKIVCRFLIRPQRERFRLLRDLNIQCNWVKNIKSCCGLIHCVVLLFRSVVLTWNDPTYKFPLLMNIELRVIESQTWLVLHASSLFSRISFLISVAAKMAIVSTLNTPFNSPKLCDKFKPSSWYLRPLLLMALCLDEVCCFCELKAFQYRIIFE